MMSREEERWKNVSEEIQSILLSRNTAVHRSKSSETLYIRFGKDPPSFCTASKESLGSQRNRFDNGKSKITNCGNNLGN